MLRSVIGRVLHDFSISVFLLDVILLGRIKCIFVLVSRIYCLFVYSKGSVRSFGRYTGFRMRKVRRIFGFSFVFVNGREIDGLTLGRIVCIVVALKPPICFVF